MENNNCYNTKQKGLILDIIKNQKSTFTIKDIYNELDGNVGLTTIYRLVDKLVATNKLEKNISKDNITYYQYLKECHKENHFYLKCDKCGNFIHIDCDCIKDLARHICQEHNFKLNNEKTIINGLCNKCIKNS